VNRRAHREQISLARFTAIHGEHLIVHS